VGGSICTEMGPGFLKVQDCEDDAGDFLRLDDVPLKLFVCENPSENAM